MKQFLHIEAVLGQLRLVQTELLDQRLLRLLGHLGTDHQIYGIGGA